MTPRLLLAVFVLFAALTMLSRADSLICPPFVDGPWFQANVTISPFSWCESGDIGRIPVGLEGFGFPHTWTMGSLCNDDLCKGIMQAELVSSSDSGEDSELFGLYATDPSVLVVSDLSNLSNHDVAVMEFGIGPIYTFRLVLDDANHVKAVILNTGHKDGVTGWYFQWISRNAFGLPYPSGSLLNLTQSFQARYAIVDVNYYYDSRDLILVIGKETHVEFVQLTSLNIAIPFAYVYIVTPNNPEHLSPSPIALRTFIQPGKTTLTSRQLIAVFGYNVVHVIAPPPQTPEIASYTIEWFNPSARSVILKTPSNTRLFHVEFFPEQGIRTGQDKPYMWLAYVTDTYTTGETAVRSNLTLVQLPEFAHWEPETAPLAASIDLSAESALAAVSVSNPLGLSNPPCAWNAMMNTSSESPCSTPRVTKTLHSRIGRGIKQIAVRNIPAVSWIGDFVPPYCKLGNCSTPAMTVIFGVENSTLTVFALDPTLDTTYDARSEQINYFNMSGLAHRMAVSQNGLHVIPSVNKYLWELQSMSSFTLLCEDISTGHNFTSFQLELIEPWRAYCWRGLNLSLSIGDFLQYVSLCPFGSVCSSSSTYKLGSIGLGAYSPYPISTAHCEPGFMCPLGFIRPCPAGFICPDMKQLFPTPCPANSVADGKSCWAEGLIEPIPAPDGFVPIYAHGPPLPAPPGQYSYNSRSKNTPVANYMSYSGLGGHTYFGVGRSRRALPNLSQDAWSSEFDVLASIDFNNGLAQDAIQLAPCVDGDYCPLGRHALQNRRCPAGFFCPNSSVHFPYECHSPSYCPEGSSTERPCPAGYFCVDTSTIETCLQGYYCPSGSTSQQLCRAGYFCSNASKEEICPVGSFCRAGSISPSACSFLSCFSERTEVNRPIWVLIIFAAILVALLAWYLVVTWYPQIRSRCKCCRDIYSDDGQTIDARDEEQPLLQSAEAKAQAKVKQEAKDAKLLENKEKRRLARRKRKWEALDPTAAKNYLTKVTADDDSLALDFPYPPGTRIIVPAPVFADRKPERQSYSVDEYKQDHTGLGGMVEFPYPPNTIIIPREPDFAASFRPILDATSGPTVHFENLTLRRSDGSYSLRNVSGSFQSGTMTAIVGSSGCGKTTLLQVIAGNYHGKLSGCIWMNGNKELRPIDYPNCVGLVTQEDIMHRDISVEEHLMFNANMRHTSSNVQVVDDMLEQLGLLGIRHMTVGSATSSTKISGGERKRLNIGMELISKPLVLLIDEPTSGLDAANSEEVCRLLRRIAQTGITVVAAIHQPRASVMSMFDSLLLLQDGRRVYMGKTANAAGFVETFYSKEIVNSDAARTESGVKALELTTNPADFLIDVVSKVKRFPPRRKVEMTDQVSNATTISPPRPASWATQFWYFFVRSCQQQVYDLKSIAFDLALVVLTSLIFGLVFMGSHYSGPTDPRACSSVPESPVKSRCSMPLEDPIAQVALMTTLAIALQASMVALRIVGYERAIFWRESSFSSSTPYFWGKELSYLPRTIILPLVFAFVFYALVVPRIGFWMLYFIYLLTWWCAGGFAVLISTVLRPQLATVTTVVYVFGLSLFSSVAVSLPVLGKIPVIQFFPYGSFFRWLVEAYYLSEMKEWKEVYGERVYHGVKENFGYESDRLWREDILIPLAMALLTRVLATILIELFNRRERRRRGIRSSFSKCCGCETPPEYLGWQDGLSLDGEDDDDDDDSDDGNNSARTSINSSPPLINPKTKKARASIPKSRTSIQSTDVEIELPLTDRNSARKSKTAKRPKASSDAPEARPSNSHEASTSNPQGHRTSSPAQDVQRPPQVDHSAAPTTALSPLPNQAPLTVHAQVDTMDEEILDSDAQAPKTHPPQNQPASAQSDAPGHVHPQVDVSDSGQPGEAVALDDDLDLPILAPSTDLEDSDLAFPAPKNV